MYSAFSDDNGFANFLFRTPEEGLQGIKEFHTSRVTLQELWLDHDMGINEETGDDITIKPVVDWLEEQGHNGDPLDVQYIFVHTSNGYAAEDMMRALTPYYPHVIRTDLPVRESTL